MKNVDFEFLQEIVNWIGVVGVLMFGIGAVSHDPDPHKVDPKWVQPAIDWGLIIMVVAIFLTGLVSYLMP